MINTKLQSIIDTKSAIGNAITNKGGTITSSTPFFNYAAEIDSISTGGGAYSTFVAQDQTNAKYEAYAGFHAIDNPTPNLSNNFTFNRWLLNNSATGDVVLPNVITSQVTTVPFVNNSAGINEAYMPFVNNSVSYGGIIQSITTNNGFIYAGGQTNEKVQKFYEDNLAFVSNTANYGLSIRSITTNNGFIYVGGIDNKASAFTGTVQKFNESTLAFVGNTAGYGGQIWQIKTNAGFIYAVGTGTNSILKFNESTLDLVANSTVYGGGATYSIALNNNFIYVGGEALGGTNRGVGKYHQSNLVLVGNTVNYGGSIFSIAANNGFIYAGGDTNRTVQKFHESNLAFVGNTDNYDGTIIDIKISNGFIYAAGINSTSTVSAKVKKYYESNLAFVGETSNYGGQINTVAINNGFIYAGGLTDTTVKKYVEQSNNLVETPIFAITQIKE
jgi:hypothetical protein